MQLNRKVVIITGAAEGIGEGYAYGLAKRGAKVVIGVYEKDERQHKQGEEIAKEIKEEGGEAIWLPLDVASEESTLKMAEATLKQYGRIDGLINNACVQTAKEFHEYTVAEFDLMMNVNVRGIWLCCKAVFPAMKEQGKGKIINIGSQTFNSGWTNLAPYVASKGAVIGLSRAMAREVGPYGIRINVLSPGLTVTEGSLREVNRNIFPGKVNEWLDGHVKEQCIKHPGYPQDLVGTAAYLISDDSDFVTGQTILCDGGWAFN